MAKLPVRYFLLTAIIMLLWKELACGYRGGTDALR